MTASTFAGTRDVGRVVALNLERIVRDEARSPVSINDIEDGLSIELPVPIKSNQVDKVSRSDGFAQIDLDSLPESISMLTDHGISVPAGILLETLEWEHLLRGDGLPQGIQVKVDSQYKQLQMYAKSDYDLAPDLAISIFKEFQIWCSMVLPHAMLNANTKSDGLLFEAIGKFNSCENEQVLAGSLNTKIARVKELICEGKIDDALMMARRIDEEVNRMKISLDLIKKGVEEHLKARSTLILSMGLSALGLTTLYLAADLAGCKGDFFVIVRGSGELLWMAMHQWMGGWEYEQFLIKQLQNEIVKQRMIVSMHAALDSALMAQTYETPRSKEATSNAGRKSECLSEHGMSQNLLLQNNIAPSTNVSNLQTRIQLSPSPLENMVPDSHTGAMPFEEPMVILSRPDRCNYDSGEEDFIEI